MKVFFFNDSRSQNNWGCRATTEALISLLKQKNCEIVGTLELEQISTIKTNKLVTKIKENIKGFKFFFMPLRKLAWKMKKLAGPRMDYLSCFDDFEKFSNRILKGYTWNNYLLELQNCDLVLVNGEGSIYGNEQKGFHTLFICWFSKIKLNKKCILVNHTADFSNPEMKVIAENVYPLLDDVVFREPISFEKYNSLYPHSDDIYFPDAAFVHNYVCRSKIKTLSHKLTNWEKFDFDPTHENYVCILGSSILGRPESGGLFPVNEYGALIKQLKEENYNIVMVASDTTDEAPLSLLANKWQLPYFDASTNLVTGISILANSTCVIGGRWHPSILASIGGTPSIMMTANTSKTRAFLQMFGLNDEVFDPFDLEKSGQRIIKILKEYTKSEEILRQSIKNFSQKYATLAKENVRKC